MHLDRLFPPCVCSGQLDPQKMLKPIGCTTDKYDFLEVHEMRSVRITLCLTVLLMMAGRLFAQAGATGTILGTVTDSSGAIVPSAKVTVTDTATNVPFRTTTSSSG